MKFLMAFLAGPVQVDGRERWRSFIGAGFGILVTALLGRWVVNPDVSSAWLIAPMGASAVLVFAVSGSPMAQPWAVIGGNTISALVGISCVLTLGDTIWAAPLSVLLAIALMFSLRCLHPPGGATALLAVLVQATNYQFALVPVLLNSIVLVAAAVVYNNLTGRRYPHTQRSGSAQSATVARFSATDLDAALAHYNQVLDVSRDDLEQLLHYAELNSYHRTLGDLRCENIMSRDPIAVQFGTALDEAWALMRQQRIKALPVIDRTRRLVGILTMADFLREVGLGEHDGIGVRWRAFVKRSGMTHSTKPEVVGQIMTRKVQVASADRHIIELVPLFSNGGHHHIPIIDAENRLVGIITQTDLLRALYRAVKPDA
ncbi:MAG: HPP family protein [Burkholderiales bacterium]|nr:HPP family protein [Burkholderiales bacterium]